MGRMHRKFPSPPPEPIQVQLESFSEPITMYRFNALQMLQEHGTQLRQTCSSNGGKPVFGFDTSKIGSKAIRYGAAMALFLVNASTVRIASEAFMAYIRPQVLE
jgi:hypothetical protein